MKRIIRNLVCLVLILGLVAMFAGCDPVKTSRSFTFINVTDAEQRQLISINVSTGDAVNNQILDEYTKLFDGRYNIVQSDVSYQMGKQLSNGTYVGRIAYMCSATIKYLPGKQGVGNRIRLLSALTEKEATAQISNGGLEPVGQDYKNNFREWGIDQSAVNYYMLAYYLSTK